MSTEALEPTPTTAPEAPASESQETTPTTETTEAEPLSCEERAAQIGWKKDFKPNSKSVRIIGAEEWIERYENAPIIRSATRDIRHQYDATKTELEELKRQFSEQQQYLAKFGQTSYEKDLAEIEAKLEYAVENGDTTSWRNLDKQRDELKAKHQPIKSPEPKVQENVHPEMQAFIERNPWYKENEEMASYANALGLHYQNQGIKGVDLLKEVEKEVRRTRSDYFKNPARNAAPSVNEGEPVRSNNSGGYARLPLEAKKACDKYCDRWVGKIFKSVQEARNTYVKEYNSS